MRILYDDDALYVGFACEHAHTPIIERLTRRDQDSESEWVSVFVDPRGEGKAAFVFGVFFFRIRERFDSLDVTHLDQTGELPP